MKVKNIALPPKFSEKVNLKIEQGGPTVAPGTLCPGARQGRHLSPPQTPASLACGSHECRLLPDFACPLGAGLLQQLSGFRELGVQCSS